MILRPDTRRRYWLAPVVLLSGCRLRQLLTRMCRTLAASCSRSVLRLGVLASELRVAEPIGITSRNPWRTPSSPIRPSQREPRETQSRRCAHATTSNRIPLLRFSSPSALAGPRCAVQGSHAPDDPASAFFLTGLRPARPRTFAISGVALAVFRRANSKRCSLFVRTCRLRSFASFAADKSDGEMMHRNHRHIGDPRVLRIDRRTRFDRAHEGSVTSSATACNSLLVDGHAPTAFLFRGVPLPSNRALAAWP